MTIRISRDSSVPVYRRIVEAIRRDVLSGRLSPGDKLPPHLLFARQLKVNPTTVRRAYELLETQGVIVRRQGSGTFVAPDVARSMARSGGREVGRVVTVCGVKNLSDSPRPTLFIGARILDGFYSLMDGRAGAPQFVDALTDDLAAGLNENDVVLINHAQTGPLDAVADLLKRNVRVISLLESPVPPGVPQVGYDRHQAVSLACAHLISCGYTRIGYVGRRKHWVDPVSPKFVAFTDAMTRAGIDLHARYLLREVDIAPGDAYAAMRAAIETGDLPEAFFVDTDYKAMEAIRALSDAGLRVPQDVGIASYDDIVESAAFSPALTTVHTPLDEIGRTAATMLLDWADTTHTPADVTLPSRLVVRDSTQNLASRKLTER